MVLAATIKHGPLTEYQKGYYFGRAQLSNAIRNLIEQAKGDIVANKKRPQDYVTSGDDYELRRYRDMLTREFEQVLNQK